MNKSLLFQAMAAISQAQADTMTTKPTPASQPSTAPECKFCGTTDRMSNPCSGPDGVGHIFDLPIPSPSPARSDECTCGFPFCICPSPARSDKEAEHVLDSEVERMKFEAWAAAYGLDCDYIQGKVGVKYLHDQANDAWEGWLAAKIDAWMGPAGQAQERAPSGDTETACSSCGLTMEESRHLARRATAGTTAAPTCSGCDPAEGFCKVCREAERATAGNTAPTEAEENEPLSNHSEKGFPCLCCDPTYLVSNTATAAPDRPDNFGEEVTRLVNAIRKPCSMAWRDSLVEELIELIDPTPDGIERAATAAPGDLSKLARWDIDRMNQTMECWPSGDYVKLADVEKLLASNAGAAPGTETHDDRCRLIRDFGDTKLIADVQAGRISIHAAVEKVRRAAPSTSPVDAKEQPK